MLHRPNTLLQAAALGHTEALQLLLSAGASIHARDHAGLTPADEARRRQQVNR